MDWVFETADDVSRTRLGEIAAHGFGFRAEDYPEWFERAGHENLRVLKRGEHVVAGLMQIPMGQFFGGRSVPTLGIAGVGIAVEERGAGVAKALMLATLREARGKGIALSTLYPATVPLYQRVGYERAGARYRIEVDPKSLDVQRPTDVAIVEIPAAKSAAEIPEEMRVLYTESARASDGYLDRGPYVWTRVVSPRGQLPTKTFGVRVAGRLDGYVVLSHKMEAPGSSVFVTDLAVRSGRAAQAILRLLGEYRSLATKVTWFGGAVDVFTSLLPECQHHIVLEDFFMLRVVDAERALATRGYPRAVNTRLVIELDDRSLPENSGVYTLDVERGVAKISRGAAPDLPSVRLGERGLATLFTGHTPVETLAHIGALEGDDEARARLAALFAGPAPVTRDFF
ncbi:Acetyltransferase [Labilithrix luteola]|uniref:Acetyltransferase n=1 Tax=Labilithrix luteola TaxID=1391654 RepID=A0A0K1PJ49_9BACT|nr:Acetyltransferase [Labilithrix luteola]